MFRLRSSPFLLLLLAACQHEPVAVPHGYPSEVGELLINRCATTGCHNAASADAAGGLDLSTWNSMVKGGRRNAAVVAGHPTLSVLWMSTNTDSTAGPTVKPLMPYEQMPLSESEQNLIREWIADGARNAKGTMPFSGITAASALVVLNNRCGQVMLLDWASGRVARAIQLDTATNNGTATQIAVSPNNGDLYVLFSAGSVVHYDGRSLNHLRTTELPLGTWRTLAFAANGSLIATSWSGNSALSGGHVVEMDVQSLAAEALALPSDSIYFPMGFAQTDGFWMAANTANFVYRRVNDSWTRLRLDDEPINFNEFGYRPTAICAAGPLMAVACEGTDEVRFLDATNGAIKGRCPVASYPQKMVFDAERNLLYVACQEEEHADGKGLVMAVNLSTLAVDHQVYTGYQPRAITMDPTGNWLYVANRNADPVGADEPHHYSECEGRNGYLCRIELEGFRLDPDYKTELGVDPYELAP